MQSLAGGAKRITYRIGPLDVVPGQNSINLRPISERPQVDGYITRIRPDLIYYTYFCRIHPFMRGAFRVKP